MDGCFSSDQGFSIVENTLISKLIELKLFISNRNSNFKKKYSGDTRIWTMDLSDCSRLLYHWAISPHVENYASSRERQVGVTCQNCQSPLAVVTKSKCHHYRSINCISEHLKRRWYNGQHSCLPSSWSGFDSRPTQFLRFFFIIIYRKTQRFRVLF